MGWPGIDFEELAELAKQGTTDQRNIRAVEDVKEAVSVAQEHLAVAYGKLEALHKRCGYAVVRDVMHEVKTAGEVLSGSA